MGRKLRGAGSRALVTGASAGIGREIAIALAQDGFDLVLVARREARLRDLARVLARDYRVEARVLADDLEDPAAPVRLLGATEGEGRPIDLLVNNAGFGAFRDVLDTEPARLSAMIAVNVAALTALSQGFAQAMRARGRGRILNVASVAAFAPVPGAAVYGATKAYVLSFTEALAAELAGTGVTATAVCPGLTETEFSTVATGAKGNRLIPDLVKLDAKRVAREAVDAALAGEAVRVNGLMNRLGVEWVRLQPRALVRRAGRLLGRSLQHGF